MRPVKKRHLRGSMVALLFVGLKKVEPRQKRTPKGIYDASMNRRRPPPSSRMAREHKKEAKVCKSSKWGVEKSILSEQWKS
jgi:hypothetical protein